MRNMLPHIASGQYTHPAWGSDRAAGTDPGTHEAENKPPM